MIVVIIAGGSGTRLWPLSTPDYPKHLLRVNGSQKSLLQSAYDRAKKISNKVYVVTETGHSKHVFDQLPDLNKDAVIVEPARRGTASCIIAALAHLGEEDLDEPIAFMPADHYVRDIDGYLHSFNIAALASKQEGRIVLIGVEPDHPSTGFGYIQKGDLFEDKTFIFNVKSFKEKPDYDKAVEYLKSGNYLWNCGYFVGPGNEFIKRMKSAAPDLYKNYTDLKSAKDAKVYEEIYLSFKNQAVDYALIEHINDLLVVPATFDWMDLGSFSDLQKATGSDSGGNYIEGRVEVDGVENSFVQNLEDKPIAVIGLDNVVIINSPNGVLVARKDLAQKVGDVSKRFSEEDAR